MKIQTLENQIREQNVRYGSMFKLMMKESNETEKKLIGKIEKLESKLVKLEGMLKNCEAKNQQKSFSERGSTGKKSIMSRSPLNQLNSPELLNNCCS